MNRAALTLKAIGERLRRRTHGFGLRLGAQGARLHRHPEPAEALPEPLFFGDAERGRRLVAGEWQACGHSVPIGAATIWAAALPEARLEGERQACLWIEDLAALGNRAARMRAQAFVLDWCRRFGSGRGPGWRPDIAGRRVSVWASQGAFLTRDLAPAERLRFWRCLVAQARYLERAAPRAPEGLPRIEALSGLVVAGLAVPQRFSEAALVALGRAAEAAIDTQGGTPSRAPEDLAEILILLIWTARLLENAGLAAAPAHLAAIVRAVPVIRALRLGDGSLPRFHGGASGNPARLDQALAELRLGAQPKPRLPMGYARLAGGRLVAVLDGDVPPAGEAAGRAHAGTLAFEFSAGRQPIVVNAGPGAPFGPDWQRAARATALHSTVEIDGVSSSRLGAEGIAARTFGARLEAGPSLVSVRQAQDATGQWLLATHDGYVATHGLLHERRLFADARGRELRGEEILYVTDARARAQYDRHGARAGRPPGMTLRFHLHPAVEADLDPARHLVELRLPSGEIWAFRPANGALDLEASQYLDPAAPAPIPTKQVVVRADVMDYLGQLNWAFLRIAEAERPPVRT